MVPIRSDGFAPACDCCGSNSFLYRMLDFFGDLKVFGNYLCEPCFRLAGKHYKGNKTLDCLWCGLSFVLFREGGLRREYIVSGIVDVGFCWPCMDAMREDLKRAAQTANSNARRARLLNATPGWADRDAIKAVYEEARRISRETGILHPWRADFM